MQTDECKKLTNGYTDYLIGVRGLNKAIHQRMDRLHNSLVQRGILRDDDPKDVQFRKIVECLQCRNAISHKDENDEVESVAPGYSRAVNDHGLKSLVPLFKSHAYLEGAEQSSEERDESHEGRSGRIPKAPAPVNKQILESVTNSSRIVNDAKITQILHNTTIVERDDSQGTSCLYIINTVFDSYICSPFGFVNTIQLLARQMF